MRRNNFWIIEQRHVPSGVKRLSAWISGAGLQEDSWNIVGSTRSYTDARVALSEAEDAGAGAGWFHSGVEFRIRRLSPRA